VIADAVLSNRMVRPMLSSVFGERKSFQAMAGDLRLIQVKQKVRKGSHGRRTSNCQKTQRDLDLDIVTSPELSKASKPGTGARRGYALGFGPSPAHRYLPLSDNNDDE
jgi:hypothetical protein